MQFLKRHLARLLLPNFLFEISKQMREQDNRFTADPIFQVRYNDYVVTEQGYNDHHWVMCCDHGPFYRSDKNELSVIYDHLLDNHYEFCREFFLERCDPEDGVNYDFKEDFRENFDPLHDELPEGITKIYMQEVEKIASTHLTLSEAEDFIKRKQHDYPPLYTYAASAYWSPQIKNLRNWLQDLTA